MKIFCNSCNAHTNHEVLREYKQDFYREQYQDMEIDFAHGTWQIIQCSGCETVSFRETWLTSEDIFPGTSEPEPAETLYPRRSVSDLAPKIILNLPGKLRRLYAEVIYCYNYGQHVLCAAGLRALIEGICAEEGVVNGPVKTTKRIERKSTLQGKIEGLHEKGVLTHQNAQVLHKHRYIGNDALHQLDIPEREELQLGIQIAEHILLGLYDVPSKGGELEVRRGIRKKAR